MLLSRNDGTYNKIIMTPSLGTKSNERINQQSLEQFFVKQHFHERNYVELVV